MVLKRMYGEGETRGEPANPGSPGRIPVKCVYVYCIQPQNLSTNYHSLLFYAPFYAPLPSMPSLFLSDNAIVGWCWKGCIESDSQGEPANPG